MQDVVIQDRVRQNQRENMLFEVVEIEALHAVTELIGTKLLWPTGQLAVNRQLTGLRYELIVSGRCMDTWIQTDTGPYPVSQDTGYLWIH